MKKITESNLISAFAGESQAHMRYLAFAEIAEIEGFPNVSRLFRAIADAERIHATNHFRA
ncbi:MAG: ferritin family protein, partial [Candidatus Bathyarchaeia archaeon]